MYGCREGNATVQEQIQTMKHNEMFSQLGKLHVHVDSKLLSGFPFIDHGNLDNNLESPGIEANSELAFLPDDGVDRIAGNRAGHVQRFSGHGRYVGHWPNIGKPCNRSSDDVYTALNVDAP
jgi:hypothetical protein